MLFILSYPYSLITPEALITGDAFFERTFLILYGDYTSKCSSLKFNPLVS